MNKKHKKISLWILVWAGLLIVVLYSPVGSPGLYSFQNYFSGSQSVSFKDGGIQNTPKTNATTESSDNDLDIPDISADTKSNYTVGSYQSLNSYSRGSSNGYSSTQTYQNTNAGSDMSGGGSSLLTSGGSRNSAGSSEIAMANGLNTTSLTSDLKNSTSKQSTSVIVTSTGGTDPGLDPMGSPIPVGDGWVLLIVFGAVYAAFKKMLIFNH